MNFLHPSELLGPEHAERHERRAALRRLSRHGRLAAYRRGEFDLTTCCLWAAVYPDEVPLVNDEFESRLPRFQRFEAWGHNTIISLLETVLRGLPAGAALVLAVGDEEKFVSRPIVGAPDLDHEPTEHLLDGQRFRRHRRRRRWVPRQGRGPHGDLRRGAGSRARRARLLQWPTRSSHRGDTTPEPG